jgi:hypothetical protein
MGAPPSKEDPPRCRRSTPAWLFPVARWFDKGGFSRLCSCNFQPWNGRRSDRGPWLDFSHPVVDFSIGAPIRKTSCDPEQHPQIMVFPPAGVPVVHGVSRFLPADIL